MCSALPSYAPSNAKFVQHFLVYCCLTWMAPPAVPGVLLDPAGSQGAHPSGTFSSMDHFLAPSYLNRS